MVDHEFTCIWNDSLDQSIELFKKEFIKLTSVNQREGFYTFFFSRYDDFKIITETLYCIVYKETAIFFWPSMILLLELDEQLKVVDGTMIKPSDTIMSKLADTPNMEYLGFVPNSMGYCFDVYTLKEKKALEVAKHMFDNSHINIDSIIVNEDDMIDASLNFLDHKIENYYDNIKEAIVKDEDSIQLNENPYADMYYNKSEIFQMIQKKRMSNEQNV